MAGGAGALLDARLAISDGALPPGGRLRAKPAGEADPSARICVLGPGRGFANLETIALRVTPWTARRGSSGAPLVLGGFLVLVGNFIKNQIRIQYRDSSKETRLSLVLLCALQAALGPADGPPFWPAVDLWCPVLCVRLRGARVEL